MELTITFSRERLHSSIDGAMRRKRIPRTFRGYDLIRGAVFGIVDHPEYTMEVALERAMEVCRLPGSPVELEEAYIDAFDCIEPILRECDFYEDGDSKKKKLSERELVRKVIEGLVYDIQKEYCYTSTIEYMRCKKFKNYFAYDILKNMIFKKLIADDSTEECMYEYAFRKTFALATDAKRPEEIKDAVDEAVAEILPEGESLYTYVLKCVEEIRLGK